VSDNEAATDQRRANKRSESRVDDQSRVPHSPQRLWAGLAFGALKFKLASFVVAKRAGVETTAHLTLLRDAKRKSQNSMNTLVCQVHIKNGVEGAEKESHDLRSTLAPLTPFASGCGGGDRDVGD
jgi:hypothetical protein